MSTPWKPTVSSIVNGSPASAEVINPILSQLASRDQHLFEKFEQVENKSVLRIFDQNIDSADTDWLEDEAAPAAVVYLKEEAGAAVVARAKSLFSSTGNQSFFTPAASCYVLGIALGPVAARTDVITHGLINEENFDVTDLLYANETFRIGPYYLAPEAGKISATPSNVPVLVGYAYSTTSFFVCPSVSEFSEIFTHHQYSLLDRPAGTISVSSDDVWSVATTDGDNSDPGPAANRVGWISASYAESNYGITAPEDAKFFYNIPPANVTDDALSDALQEETQSLASVLPPVPYTYNRLTMNGAVLLQKDAVNTDGAYVVNEYGIWWMYDTTGSLPWLSTLSSSYEPSNDWDTIIEAADPEARARFYFSFGRFNPALSDTIVTSITSANQAIVVRNSDEEESSTGALVLEFSPQINVSEGDPSPTALQSIAHLGGIITQATTPVVSSIIAGGGISVSRNAATGAVTVSSTTSNFSGSVNSIDPINTRFEYVGLTSVLAIPDVTSADYEYGLFGQFVLPPAFQLSGAIYLKVLGFVSETVTDPFSIGLSPYISITAPTGGVVSSDIPVAGTTVNFVIPDNTAEGTLITASIPVSLTDVAPGSIVSFKILRTVAPTNGGNDYSGDLKITSIYWKVGV